MASNMRYHVFNSVCSCETLILIRAVLQLTSKIKRNLDTSQNYLLFQSSWHMELTVAKWMTVSLHFLFKAIKSKTRIIHVGLFWTKLTLKRGGRRPFRSILFKGDGSNAQMFEMFGNWWNCLNSFVRGCSSRERLSMLDCSWISSSNKSFSESWEVQLTGILDVVSNNEPTIMHVSRSVTITGCRPRGHARAWRGICWHFLPIFIPGWGEWIPFKSTFVAYSPRKDLRDL